MANKATINPTEQQQLARHNARCKTLKSAIESTKDEGRKASLTDELNQRQAEIKRLTGE